jgi:hypothetical protein
MTVNQSKKGTPLELLTAAYFQAHGFLVRRSVTFTVADGTAEATDIDLLAIRFSVPLAEERLVADCKDRKKSRPFERILWTRGLATFADAQQGVVVTPKAPWQAREFAAKGHIEILGPDEIDQFLHSKGDIYTPFGEAEPTLSYQFDQRKKRVQYQDKELFREDLRLRQMLVAGKPLTNLNRVIKVLSESNKFFKRATSPDVIWLRRYLYFNAAVVASVMLLRFAAESKWTPEKDWSDHARKRLTYGDVTPQKARQLAEMAFNRDFFNGLPTPFYTEEIVDLLASIISQPVAASMIPYIIDFQLFGRLLGGILSKPGIPQLVSHDDTLKLARRLLSVLSYAADVPASIWNVEHPRTDKALTNKDNKDSVPKATDTTSQVVELVRTTEKVIEGAHSFLETAGTDASADETTSQRATLSGMNEGQPATTEETNEVVVPKAKDMSSELVGLGRTTEEVTQAEPSQIETVGSDGPTDSAISPSEMTDGEPAASDDTTAQSKLYP